MNNSPLYRVVTLSDCMGDPATVAWMLSAGVNLPDTIPPGRYPTPNELQTILDTIPGLQVHFTITPAVWVADLISRKDITWATLAVRDYSGDPEQPHHFIFQGGWDEVILLVCAELVKICGPLVLLHDSGAPPALVL